MPRSHAADDQQSAQDIAQDQADAKDALPAEVMSVMSVLRRGDAQPLAKILATYPQYREEILQKAATMVGNETVSAALHAGSVAAVPTAAASDPSGVPDPSTVAAVMQQVHEEKKPPEAPAAQGPQDAVKQFANDVKNDQQDAVGAGTPVLQRAPDPNSWEDSVQLQVSHVENAKDLAQIIKGHPTLRQQIVDEASKYLSPGEIARAIRIADGAAADHEQQEQQKPPTPAPEEPKPGDKPPGLTAPVEQEPAAWIGQARAFNAAHESLMSEFNLLTSFALLDANRESGAVADPERVAYWQREHGLEPDGKIGHQTVAAARDFNKRAKGPAPAPVDEDTLKAVE
jgi:hypothetical protein